MDIFLLALLVALTVHRVWNYEDVTEPLRRRVPAWFKPLSCPVCNPFWLAIPVAVGFQLAGAFPPLLAAVFPVAAYWPLRLAVFLYERLEGRGVAQMVPGPLAGAVPLPTAPVGAGAPAAPVAPVPKSEGECKTCAQTKAFYEAERRRTDSFAGRIVVIAAGHAAPAAAAAGRLKREHPDHLVQLWVHAEDAKVVEPGVEVRSLLETRDWAEKEPVKTSKLAAHLTDSLMRLGNAKVVVTDLTPQTPAHIIQALSRVSQVRAFAWVFEVPANGPVVRIQPGDAGPLYHSAHTLWAPGRPQALVAALTLASEKRIWSDLSAAVRAAKPVA